MSKRGHFLSPKRSLLAGNLAAKWIQAANENQFESVSKSKLADMCTGLSSIKDEANVAAMDVEKPQSIKKNNVLCAELGAR